MSGIQLKIICWVGSGGAGLSFICTHMVTPMITGQKPEMQERADQRQDRRIERDQAERA